MTTPLFVATFGSGRNVLCLHGIEAHGLRFVGLAARVPGIHVVAPDLRGHGRSPMAGPWTIEQHMRDLVPLLHELGPDTVVVGHSYGGLLAWELARAAPDKPAGLVLVDPAIGVSAELAAASTDEFTITASQWPDAAAAFAAMNAGRRPEAGWAVALDVSGLLRRDPDGWLRPMVAREAVVNGWMQMQQPIRPTDWRGPTLLLEAGLEKGAFVSPYDVAFIRGQLGDLLRHEILDATHVIPSDYPDLLAQHFGDFLTTHPPGATRS